MTTERSYIEAAAAALSDPWAGNRPARISFLLRAMQRDPDPDYRRKCRREFLDLTDPEPNGDVDL